MQAREPFEVLLFVYSEVFLTNLTLDEDRMPESQNSHMLGIVLQ